MYHQNSPTFPLIKTFLRIFALSLLHGVRMEELHGRYTIFFILSSHTYLLVLPYTLFSPFVCSQYFSYNGILILVGISVLVQLSHSLKVLLTLGVLVAYCIMNISAKHQIFDNYDIYVHFNHQ